MRLSRSLKKIFLIGKFSIFNWKDGILFLFLSFSTSSPSYLLEKKEWIQLYTGFSLFVLFCNLCSSTLIRMKLNLHIWFYVTRYTVQKIQEPIYLKDLKYVFIYICSFNSLTENISLWSLKTFANLFYMCSSLVKSYIRRGLNLYDIFYSKLSRKRPFKSTAKYIYTQMSSLHKKRKEKASSFVLSNIENNHIPCKRPILSDTTKNNFLC